MNKKNNTQSQTGTISAMGLFALFASCILIVLLSGAGIYNRIATRDAASYNARTCCTYLATKLNAAPAADQISIVSFGGEDAVSIPETIDGKNYITLIYCYGGWLRELFADENGMKYAETGAKLMEAEAFAPVISGGILTVNVTDGEGRTSRVCHCIREGGGL